VQRSADFWAVSGMAQMADFIFSGIFGPFREWPKMVIFSGIFGPFREWRKMARILFFPGFWAVPGMAQNGYFFRIFGPFREWRKMARNLLFPGFLGRSGNGAIYHILPQAFSLPPLRMLEKFLLNKVRQKKSRKSPEKQKDRRKIEN
jgi:hypothetical protein